jgi:hypothetical protein
MNTDTPRTDSNAGYYCGYGIQRNPDIYIDPKGPFVSANFARELERENAQLREAIADLHAIADSSYGAADHETQAAFDSWMRGNRSFLPNTELAMQKLADEAHERGEYKPCA